MESGDHRVTSGPGLTRPRLEPGQFSGDLRGFHTSLGAALILGLAARFVWALVGPEHAPQELDKHSARAPSVSSPGTLRPPWRCDSYLYRRLWNANRAFDQRTGPKLQASRGTACSQLGSPMTFVVNERPSPLKSMRGDQRLSSRQEFACEHKCALNCFARSGGAEARDMVRRT